MAAGIEWLGHATFRLTGGGRKVYVDPFQVEDPDDADLVLVTHDHHDHCSPEDIEKVSRPDTVIAGPESCRDKVAGLGAEFVAVGQSGGYEAAGVSFSTVPAYTVGKDFHPRSAGGVGYIVEIGGERVYHAGDTDRIGEMTGVEADVALLPVGGKYTMTASEAAEAFRMMKAGRGVPMHYGSIVGSSDDADEFERLIGG